jgi:hypothetical protein
MYQTHFWFVLAHSIGPRINQTKQVRLFFYSALCVPNIQRPLLRETIHSVQHPSPQGYKKAWVKSVSPPPIVLQTG